MKQHFTKFLCVFTLLFFAIATANAQAGTTNGTYHFGSVGVADSHSSGFKTQQDKFAVSNDAFWHTSASPFADYANSIYFNGTGATTLGATGSLTIKAEGGSTCKTFTLKNLQFYIANSGNVTRHINTFVITLKNSSGATIASHSISSQFAGSTRTLHGLNSLPFSVAYPTAGYTGVAEINLSYVLANAGSPAAPNSLFFRSIVLEDISAGATEYFEDETVGTSTFTNNVINPFTGSLTPSASFKVGTLAGNFGYNSSANFIESPNANPASITSSTQFKMQSLYLYPSTDNGGSNQTASVSVTFTGKLGGVTQFTYTPPSADFTAASWSNTTNRGFSLVNFATPGHQNTLIDELVVDIGGAGNYIAIDNFTFIPSATITSTTWNGTTWSNGVPSSTIDAIIASNTAPASFTCEALTINSGVSLTTTGITATINGNIVNNGNGIAGTGGLTIAANSTISGSAFSFNGVLTVNTGATLTTGGLLTLSSNATNTARVANSAGAIDGTVAVQRYIPGKRAYRFLTAPLSSNGLTAVNVSNSWQTQTHVVGPTGTGLDAAKPLYSMLSYASGNWQGVTNPSATTLFNSTAAASNKAFAIFITGDRMISTSSTTQFNNVTLSAVGKLLQGTQTFSLGSLAANAFAFIGNPYASPVDLNAVFNTVGTTNINRTFYTWDPNLSTTGGYVTISWNGSSYTITPGAGTSQTQILQSGQAFFVQATNTNTTTVVFEENDKSTTTINNVFGVGNGNIDNLNINLQRIENGSLSTRDGVTASFGASYNKAVTFSEDAEKLFNNEEGITIKRGTTNLSIERRPFITNTNDTIFLGLNRLVPNTNYTINLNAQGWDAGMQAILVDKLLSTETPINLQSSNQDLSITSTVADVPDRFMIVFRGTGNLPNNKLSLVATKKDKDIQLIWNIANEVGVKEYELQKSIDGTNFQAINNQVASNKGEYNNLDTKANNGINYYRVKMTMLNDDTRYSNTIAFNIQHSSSNIISIYPNPIKGNIAQIQLNDLVAGDYTIRLIDMNGKVLQNNILKNLSGTSNRIIDLSNIATGIYQLKLEGKNLSSVVSLVKSN